MKAATPRPYTPVGSEPKFDKLVDRFLLESRILNKNIREHDMQNAFLNFESKAELQSMLIDVQKKLTELRDELITTKDHFKRYEKKLINEGKGMPGKIVEPEEMKVKRFTLEAQFYTHTKEAEHLTRLIENFVEKKQTEDDKAVLRFGCRGMGKIRNSVLVLIDGMKVTGSANGFRIINSPTSPYHLISAFDYSTMHKEHAVAKSQLNNKLAAFKIKLRAVKATAAETEIGIADKTKEILKLHPEWNLNKISWRGKSLPDPSGFERHQLNGKPEVKPTEKTSVPISKAGK